MSGFEMSYDVDPPSGRSEKCSLTVLDGTWVARVHASSLTQRFGYREGDEDGYYEEHSARSNTIIGSPVVNVGHSSSFYSGGDSGWWSARLLLSDKPFGVVTQDNESSAGLGLWFTSARQVHRGQLGHRPEIVRPKIVRELSLADAAPKARDRRRGKHGWVNLAELAALAKLSPTQVLEGFFAFTDADSPGLEYQVGTAAEVAASICYQPHRQRLSLEATLATFTPAELGSLWVRAGWALTVLYLLNLGYEPAKTRDLLTV